VKDAGSAKGRGSFRGSYSLLIYHGAGSYGKGIGEGLWIATHNFLNQKEKVDIVRFQE
jgi:hypothetical protein